VAPVDPSSPTRTLERQEVQRRLGAEIPQILAETTILPVYENGTTAGFTLNGGGRDFLVWITNLGGHDQIRIETVRAR
jgi:hypothetical protein